MGDENRERLEHVLTELGIPWAVKAKKSLNINCPYCANDSSFHLGIFLDNFSYTCWRCKQFGSLFDVLNEITHIRYSEFELLFTKPRDEGNLTAEQKILAFLKQKVDKEKTIKGVVEWPPSCAMPIGKMLDEGLVQAFMKKRNLDPDFCCEQEVFIGVASKWTARFIIPVKYGGHIVAYQGRDMTGKIEPRYRTEGDVSKYLYGFDRIDVSKPVAITEGVINAWTIGDNAVASFSKSLSFDQLAIMWGVQEVPMWVLCWDIAQDGSDAFWDARKKGQELVSMFGQGKVGFIEFPPGKDCNDMGGDWCRGMLENPKLFA